MKEQDLSPAALSEQLGVNRSGISHLLNGRNKPGYDFIERMRTEFPDLDMEWFLFGKRKTRGASYKPQEQKEKQTRESRERIQQSNPKSAQQTSLFDDDNQSIARTQPSDVKRLERQVIKTILIYDDGTFEIFRNNFGQ